MSHSGLAISDIAESLPLKSDSQFLALPPEIREQIYSEILSTANSKCPTIDPEETASYQYNLDILLVNRQVHHEAKKIFQDNVFVKITTPWPEAIGHIRSEGKVPSVTTGQKAAKFQDFHLWVFIDNHANPWLDNRECFSMVICLEDLEAFTRMWHFSNLNHIGLNRHLRLNLTIQDPHVSERKIPKALQNRLLLPFGRVKDLHTFSIEGSKLLPSVEDALNKERSIPDPLPEDCLERGFCLKETGNQLMKAGSYRDALAKYVESFAAVHITVSGRVRIIHAEGYYIRELMSGAHKGMRGDFVRLILRVQLVANIVLAYLNLEEHAEAHFWGKRSVILFRQGVTGDESSEIGEDDPQAWLGQAWAARFPARDAMGKIFYRVSQALVKYNFVLSGTVLHTRHFSYERLTLIVLLQTAVAARALGKTADVATLIKAAALYLPNDCTIQDELRLIERPFEGRKEQ
ncbi:hypothetical protein ACLMJK_003251 [Lecanora helva]